MKLAIDTTSEACSVALQTSADNVLHRFAHAPRQHGERVLPWVDELLTEAGAGRQQLSAVCVSRGPGSFTSLRTGFSLALSIAYGLDIPVYPVSSLQCLAQAVVRRNTPPDGSLIISTLDARMDEIYLACFRWQSGCLRLQGDEQLLHPQQLADIEANENCIVAGNGLTAMQGQLKQQLEQTMADGRLLCLAEYWPEARDQFALLETIKPVAATNAELVYLRNRVARKTAERLAEQV